MTLTLEQKSELLAVAQDFLTARDLALKPQISDIDDRFASWEQYGWSSGASSDLNLYLAGYCAAKGWEW